MTDSDSTSLCIMSQRPRANPMREFFRGWRRKVGCMTLVMACVVMGGWLRSLACLDEFWLEGLGQYHELILTDGSVHWIVRDGMWNLDCSWTTYASHDRQARTKILEYLIRSEQYGLNPDHHTSIWHFTILPVAIPLTLLSAYLILWEPRKRV
jgi:hypothetical protein